MRRHQKRWVALAGAAAVSAAGLVASGGPAAAEERPDDSPFAWPTVTRQSSTYTIDGFEVGYVPAGLDRMGIHAKSDTGHSGERVSTIKWVQGPDAVYGRLTVIRSEDITGLEELREARYGNLKDASLEKTKNNETDAYLSEKTGDLFWVPEKGIGVEAYLQPDRWEADELAAFADGVSRRDAPEAADGAEQADEADEEAGQGTGGDAESPQESGGSDESDQGAEGAEESDAGAGEAEGSQEPAEAEQPAQEQPANPAPADSEEGDAQAVDAKGTQQQGAEDPDPASEAPEEASGAGEGTPDAEGTEGTEGTDEEPGSGEQPEGTPDAEAPEEATGTGEQPEATPDAEAPEEATDTGEEAPDAEGTEVPEGADAEGSFVPGVSLMDVRTCVAEELLTEDAETSPAEAAADRDALLKLWNGAGSDTRSEAARACASRFEAEPAQVEQVMSDLAAQAEEESDGSEPSTEEGGAPADGSDNTEKSPEPEAESGSDSEGTAESQNEDSQNENDVFELWDMLPVTMPDLSLRQ